MGSENNRGSFKEYDYYIKDIRRIAIKEEDADYYSETFNDIMNELEEKGLTVIGIQTVIDMGAFHTVIEYVPNSCIYWRGGEEDGAEQVSNEINHTKEIEGCEGQKE